MNPLRDGATTLGRLVAPLRSRATETLGRLAPRERALVLGAGGVTLLLILWLGVVEPLVDSLAGLDRDVLRGREDASSDQSGASLFAQLEAISVPIAGRERIIAMNPSTRAIGNELQQELVEMRIEGITVRALVSLLHAIENREPPIAVERIAVKRQYKDQTKVDATVVVARLRPQ